MIALHEGDGNNGIVKYYNEHEVRSLVVIAIVVTALVTAVALSVAGVLLLRYW